MSVEIGQPIPDIELLLTGNQQSRLSAYRGKPLLLYFYPKASTPGCTTEGRDFSALINKFRRQSTVILGASRDGLKAQENFKAKQQFPFELISDKEEALCNLFDVIKLKNMYGKQVRGIERSTFLIDEQGVLRQEWRKVKIKGHAEEVLEAIKAMRAAT
ncbi:peroxiredoxin [Candidatus Endoriftia persephone]|jgi:peroxiredoxin Q/BCP|uniref:thioredoxin-dependent peroxiredoxin n=3 Tax=Gammaproteobacteria TaxID=1236 RepID=G2FHU5_9GAMM|nr:peroxiredoxin [Candidatus Endoriftia persephone]EGV51783.1 thiol peroxidase, Bcp-type [endosymbiont of Riftia pachyptila (vent Ph05)]EGW53624.1 peroxiredoxin Bcp [endosymbiont of Tevnia jerichonana (vent Tica)]USF88374.1 peroxiredoxin [Candidatus Endoriftia persephone]